MSGSHDSSSGEKPARRRLLKVLASGSGAAVGMKTLPTHWTQPVLDTVALPVHAQTSPEQTSPDLSLSDPCSIDNIEGDGADPGTLVVTVSGAVIGDGDPVGIIIDIEGVLTESGTPDPSTVQSENANTAADGTYGPVNLTFNGPCFIEGSPVQRDGVQVTITSLDPRLAGEVAICTAEFTKCDVFFPD